MTSILPELSHYQLLQHAYITLQICFKKHGKIKREIILGVLIIGTSSKIVSCSSLSNSLCLKEIHFCKAPITPCVQHLAFTKLTETLNVRNVHSRGSRLLKSPLC